MSGPNTVTVTLPRMEDYADEAARASRMMQAAQLAGALTAGAFTRWMERGKRLLRMEQGGAIMDTKEEHDAH